MKENKTPPIAVYSPVYHAKLRDKVKKHTAGCGLAESAKEVRYKGDCSIAVKRSKS